MAEGDADVSALLPAGGGRSRLRDVFAHLATFSTIDWMRDLNRDRVRREELEDRRKESLRGKLWQVFDASQAWLLVAVIGALTGVVASFITVSVEWLSDLRIGVCRAQFWLSRSVCCHNLEECADWVSWTDALPVEASVGRFVAGYAIFTALSVVFALVCAWLVKAYAPFSAGSGIPEVKTVLGGFVLRHIFGVWTLVIKAVGLILSVSSGLNLGKEGPLVHVGCCVGNIFSRVFEKFRVNEVKKRELLSASCAAGVSVAFGAPIGGVLFSLEEVSSYFPHKTMWRSFLCAIVAALVLNLINPLRTGKLVLFQVSYRNNWFWFELPPFILLGVMGGLLGALFIRLNVRMTAIRRQTRLRNFPILEVSVVALVTALASYPSLFLRSNAGSLLGELFSECGASEQDVLGLCSPDFPGQIVLGLLVAGLVKFVLTIFTFGLRIPAGLFIPSLAIGACLGRAMGMIVGLIEERHSDWTVFAECAHVSKCVTPGIYALIGAASVLGGVTRMTVSLVVIVFELTGGVNLILPLMVSVMLSKWVGDAFGHQSIYDRYISLGQFPYLDARTSIPPHTKASDCMNDGPLVTITTQGNTVGSLRLLCQTHAIQGFPIVTSRQDNVVVGYIERQPLLEALDEGVRGSGVTEATRVQLSSDVPLIGGGGEFLDLHELVDQTPLLVVETTPLAQVSYMFKSLGVRFSLVVRNGRLLGIVSKKDVVRFLRSLQRSAEVAPTSVPPALFHDDDL